MAKLQLDRHIKTFLKKHHVGKHLSLKARHNLATGLAVSIKKGLRGSGGVSTLFMEGAKC